MEDFTKLNEFAEGTLDSAAEHELFGRLAASSELRSELKQLMAFNSAINSNRSLFSVPVDSKAKIFSSIGFNPAPVPQPVPITARIGDLFKKYYGRIFAGIGCAAAGAIIAYMLLGAPEPDNGKNFAGKTVNAAIPTVSSMQTDAPVKSIIRDTVVIVKYVMLKEEEKYSENLASAAENPITQEALSANNTSVPELRFSNVISSNGTKPNFLSSGNERDMPVFAINQEFPLFTSVGNLKKGLSVEVRGSQYWNMPEASMNPSKYAMFNNTGITILYDISENISLGLDMRQENFFQTFDGDDKYGLPVMYEQQPNFTSFGAVLRYDSRSTKSLRPIYQVIAGGNQVGILGRASAGFAYSPYSDISFVLGLEYSYLLYSYQNKMFNSQKLGFNYGVLFSF